SSVADTFAPWLLSSAASRRSVSCLVRGFAAGSLPGAGLVGTDDFDAESPRNGVESIFANCVVPVPAGVTALAARATLSAPCDVSAATGFGPPINSFAATSPITTTPAVVVAYSATLDLFAAGAVSRATGDPRFCGTDDAMVAPWLLDAS